MSSTILPGSTIGVLGSGQLGRMFALAARRLGYRVHTFSPDNDTPTGQVADQEIVADYLDLDAVERFAQAVDVVTFEFENVPAATAAAAARWVPVRPAGSVLHTTQFRSREKQFLTEQGFPVVPYEIVTSGEQLPDAVLKLGVPAVLKTAGFGYDGKGQTKIESLDEARRIAAAGIKQEHVLEAWVTFERELSVIGARGIDGEMACWSAVENQHRHHILDLTLAPAEIDPKIAREAEAICRALLEHLDVVGVLCVEFFLTRDGQLLINELAPRPHNSGHWTIDAAVTCQFEQQVRAVCGLPLGSTEVLRPAAMANLLGDLWSAGEPDWAAACSDPLIKLELYGKNEPRAGRKMGHLTATGATAAEAGQRALAARTRLTARYVSQMVAQQ